MPDSAGAPSAEQLVRELATPSVYPQKIDARGNILLMRMDEAAYGAASFLDDRVLTPDTQAAWVPFATVAEAAGKLHDRQPLHFIFHIGHVGSTLLSRLLDETGKVLSLREPFPLRQLAEAPNALLLDTFVRLWSRGFASTRAVVVKATSSTARLAPQLLAAVPSAHAVYMGLPSEPYLATLLAGENSPIDLRGHQAERTARLESLLGEAPPPVQSLGELAALSWLTERVTMSAIVDAYPGRVMALDFDGFLSDVKAALARVTWHFGLGTDDARLGAIARSQSLSRYSKAPEHAYSPSLRAQILAQSRRQNAGEILAGQAWLKKALARRPDIAASLL